MRKLFETITDFPGNDNAPELPEEVQPDPAARKYRSIFISDIHLGTPGCQADALLEFLRDNDSEYLYLVGDIIDGWQLRRRWYWPQAHNDVVQKLLRRARKGCKIIYVPGNHDEFARLFLDSHTPIEQHRFWPCPCRAPTRLCARPPRDIEFAGRARAPIGSKS